MCITEFGNSIEGQISKCLCDTACNTLSSHRVDKLKLKLSEQNTFYNHGVQQDSFECLLLLLDIMKKVFVPCSADEHMATSYRASLSEFLYWVVLEKKYIVCDICGPRSSAFETTAMLYITPTNNASMQELFIHDHKHRFYKTCSCCEKDTWQIST